METIDKKSVNNVDAVKPFRQRHPFLAATALLGSVVLMTGAKGGCNSGTERSPSPDRTAEVREGQDPVGRYEADYINGGAYLGYSDKILFGQHCLAYTPYDTTLNENGAQAGVAVDPEFPNKITVIASIPEMPKLVFDGLLDPSESLQPANEQSRFQLEAYGCEVEEQE